MIKNKDFFYQALQFFENLPAGTQIGEDSYVSEDGIVLRSIVLANPGLSHTLVAVKVDNDCGGIDEIYLHKDGFVNNVDGYIIQKKS